MLVTRVITYQQTEKENKSVVNLLLVDRRPSLLLVPPQVILLIQPGILIRDRGDLGCLLHLQLGDAGLVTRDPEQRRLGRNGWMEVRVLLDLRRISWGLKVVGDETSKCGVGGIFIRAEELEQQVGPGAHGRHRSWSWIWVAGLLNVSACAIRAILGMLSFLVARSRSHGFGSLARGRREVDIFRLEILGQIFDQRCQRLIHRHVVQHRKDEEDDHENHRSKRDARARRSDREQTNQAHDRQIATDQQML